MRLISVPVFYFTFFNYGLQIFLKNILPVIFTFLVLQTATANVSSQSTLYSFLPDKNEQVIATKIIDGKKVDFMVKYDLKLKYTRLRAVIYLSQSQSQQQVVTIDSAKISEWQSSPLKGKVRQSFENAVLSGEKSEEKAPFEYQYQVSFSTDEKTILCYRYDYSQSTLYAQLFILNTSLRALQKLPLPIDDEMINHGIFVNNKQEIFLLNTNPEDGIQLIRYQTDSGNSTLLELAASSTRRNHFLPYFLNDHTIYIANICENNSNLTGVMYTRFNFEKARVEEVRFHPLSKTLGEKIRALPTKGNYDLVDFKIDNQQQLTLELVKRNIVGTDYVYDTYAVNDPQQWKFRKVQVQLGEKLIFKFDSTGKLLSEILLEK